MSGFADEVLLIGRENAYERRRLFKKYSVKNTVFYHLDLHLVYILQIRTDRPW